MMENSPRKVQESCIKAAAVSAECHGALSLMTQSSMSFPLGPCLPEKKLGCFFLSHSSELNFHNFCF